MLNIGLCLSLPGVSSFALDAVGGRFDHHHVAEHCQCFPGKPGPQILLRLGLGRFGLEEELVLGSLALRLVLVWLALEKLVLGNPVLDSKPDRLPL